MINTKDLQNKFFLDEHGDFDWYPIHYLHEHIADDEINVGDVLKIGSSSESKSKKEIIELFNDLKKHIEIKINGTDSENFKVLHNLYLQFIESIRIDKKAHYIHDVLKYRIVKVDNSGIFVELVEGEA